MSDVSAPTLRLSALNKLVQLDQQQQLTGAHVRATAQQTGLSERLIWQWLASRRTTYLPPLPDSTPATTVPSGPQTVESDPATQKIGTAQDALTRKVGYGQNTLTRRVGYGTVKGGPGKTTLAVAIGDEVVPRIPDSDVRSFRADAYRSLPHAEFARIDAVYRDGIQASCRWLARHSGRECRHDVDQDGSGCWLGRDDREFAEHMARVLFPDLTTSPAGFGGTGSTVAEEWTDILGLYRFLGELVLDSPGRGHTIARLRGAQASFLLHGLYLELPNDLAYSVGTGLTTVPLGADDVDRIETLTTNPVDAAALALALCTGAIPMELGAIPCNALCEDTLVFRGPIGYAHAPDLYVWVIPPPARGLVHRARDYQQTRQVPQHKLLAGAVGGSGQTLQETAATCGITLPDQHNWHRNWIRQTGLLRRRAHTAPVRNSDLLFGLKLASKPRARAAAHR